jgi:hypothetical protein
MIRPPDVHCIEVSILAVVSVSAFTFTFAVTVHLPPQCCSVWRNWSLVHERVDQNHTQPRPLLSLILMKRQPQDPGARIRPRKTHGMNETVGRIHGIQAEA